MTVLSHQKQIVGSSSLLLIAFATVFFSRLLETFGAPAPINFVHFATIPCACGVALVKTKTENRSQINTCHTLLWGLLLFLAINFGSALLNHAGLINVVLKTLLLVEPFLLLVAIVSLPISVRILKKLRIWFEGFVFFHLLLIYCQKFAFGYCHLPGDCDNIQGVFYRSGSGHVVGASVSVSFVIYYFAIAKSQPIWVRILVLIAGLGNILASDAKQVLLILILSFAILALTKGKISEAIVYMIGFIAFMLVFSWVIQNVPAFDSFNTWIRPEIYAPDGEATKLKLSGIKITLEHFHTPLNWVLGLGPGHTIDRLGGWMLRDYEELLSPLGATRTTIGSEVWRYVASSWLATGSSLFSPFWGWAAIWGDLGFLGLASYLYLASVVWRKICLDDLSKFLVLTIMIYGFIFTQLEEPAYMLSMAIIIGIRWHEKQVLAK
ncbi:hypothetical protein [Pleurocapsa sp. PCC 7319]|uniref:hypothetical protein n=1 Tax=Pleurocapsa sp. PCC 7319 TaxID=118161 RepID=UPI00034A932D|nr:hypothetical protein [Pleurocapsa sp. PCC 7319]